VRTHASAGIPNWLPTNFPARLARLRTMSDSDMGAKRIDPIRFGAIVLRQWMPGAIGLKFLPTQMTMASNRTPRSS
jgi:hypothetical protein